MSAFGFGLFLGSIGALAVSVDAFSEEEGFRIRILIFASGFLCLFAVPPLVEGPADFFIGIFSPPGLLFAVRHRTIQSNRQAKKDIEIDLQLKRQEAAARKKIALAERDSWLKSLSEDGWLGVCNSKLLKDNTSLDCAFMLSSDRNLIQIFPYEALEKFIYKTPIELTVREILSLNVVTPRIVKSRIKIVPVSIVENKTKSPVARGLIGAVLLGPAGLVVGAASGLNAKTGTRVENHKVTEKYEADGDPQLIIGTSRDDYPVLKIKFEPVSLAEEWLYKIQAAQNHTSL